MCEKSLNLVHKHVNEWLKTHKPPGKKMMCSQIKVFLCVIWILVYLHTGLHHIYVLNTVVLRNSSLFVFQQCQVTVAREVHGDNLVFSHSQVAVYAGYVENTTELYGSVHAKNLTLHLLAGMSGLSLHCAVLRHTGCVFLAAV